MTDPKNDIVVRLREISVTSGMAREVVRTSLDAANKIVQLRRDVVRAGELLAASEASLREGLDRLEAVNTAYTNFIKSDSIIDQQP
jgi:hypothetical protein